MNLDKASMVNEFALAYGAERNTRPTLPTEKTRDLRIRLLREEFEEYLDAEKDDDVVDVADALGDMMYIIYGTAISYGIPIDEIFNEIHRSNMSKLGDDGKPIKRPDGKVLKGPNYSPPNIESILDQHS